MLVKISNNAIPLNNAFFKPLMRLVLFLLETLIGLNIYVCFSAFCGNQGVEQKPESLIKGGAPMKQFLIVCSFVLFMVMGCAPSLEGLKKDMAEKGVQPLAGSDIQKIFVGSTSLGAHPKYKYSQYLSPDGTSKGRAWGSWGEEADTGKWRINEEGHLCTKYVGPWAKVGERCVLIYPGDSKGEYVEAIVTGAKSKSNPSGIKNYTVVPGDQSGVK